MSALFICAHCNRSFHSPRSLQQHIYAKHRSRRTIAAEMEDDSVADRVIDGILARAMGEPVDDDIIDMLPDEEEWE